MINCTDNEITVKAGSPENAGVKTLLHCIFIIICTIYTNKILL